MNNYVYLTYNNIDILFIIMKASTHSSDLYSSVGNNFSYGRIPLFNKSKNSSQSLNS